MNYSFKETEKLLEESGAIYSTSYINLRFLVDAQLPKKLSDLLSQNGLISIHTLDLPQKNATSDKYLKEKSTNENLILITKDDDFLHSFIVEKKPPRLILIKTGNISNKELLEIFTKGLKVIISLIEQHPLIEITREEIIVHD
ncbi:MAG: hypothetical protein K0Q79_2832 [Flavipsychrobacter sp.]|jgi:predicted nuclease of predicted toxin-antitoxin system|nr:hypothetical protein [Flavipsychrobacter sp.]